MHYYLGEDLCQVQSIEEAAIYMTCQHDDGYGACADCIQSGDYEWAADAKDIPIDERTFDTPEAAQAWLATRPHPETEE